MSQWNGALPPSPYTSYVYSYPHKTAYRELDPPIPLEDLWSGESRDSLFLYLHVPFCEFRCGFCNLFTRAIPPADLPERYLQQLRQEARIVKQALKVSSFARIAIGGGTPTFLDERQIVELFDIGTAEMGASTTTLPVGIECSPATVSVGKVKLLHQLGVDRVSIGVQSFDAQENSALGRPNNLHQTERALDLLRATGFSTINIDLIYGVSGQTPANFVASIERALAWAPEELFLYPLYVRPLTGLGSLGAHAEKPDGDQWDEQRLQCYRAGRDLLLSSGYRQISMRMFRAQDTPDVSSPPYACQVDGMVGLGCGARSYTDRVHYSTEYAVGRSAVHSILNDYLERSPRDFSSARHGFTLDQEDQQRRYLILSLLRADGLNTGDFVTRFGRDVEVAFPKLKHLETLGMIWRDTDRWRLTESGQERSDQIGPSLFSSRVSELMEDQLCV